MFTFTSLQGARSESTAVQSILELDGGIKVLVDVGWDDTFDPQKLKELEKQVPTLSLVLLTHATISHLGAFAHCCKHIPQFTRIPVYATTPVISLGRTLIQELYASTPAAATTIPKGSLNELSYSYNSQAPSSESNILLQPPTHPEIATYFSLIHALKYSQPHQPLASPFSPPLNGLTVTAHNSGSTLGGTIWHIQHGLESIVYAVDWNQGRENVYAGAAWLGGAGGGGAEVIEQLRKPTALVCSSKGATKPALPRAKRDDPLLETVQSCVAQGGTVLIPVDSSARVLELAYLMEHAWRRHASTNGQLHSAGLYLAGRSIHSTMRYARSMLEWMDERIVQEFEDVADGSKRTNGPGDGANASKQGGPFDFKFLKLLDRKGQVDRLIASASESASPVGKVILASDSSLEWGFSKDTFRALVHDPKNLVILTGLPAPPSDGSTALASTFYRWWRDAVIEREKEGSDIVKTGVGADGVLVQVPGEGREAEVRNALRQPLEGDDLAVYRFWLAQQRQLQDTVKSGGGAALETTLDDDDVSSESSSDSEDSETHQQGKALNVATTLGRATRKKAVLADEDLGPNILLKKRGVYDYDVRGKSGRDAMFPVPVQRRRADEYGELIRLEDFVKAEERDEDGQDGEVAGKDEAETHLGKKRKWADSTPHKGQQGSGPDKRPKLEGNIADEQEVAVTDGPKISELDDIPGEPAPATAEVAAIQSKQSGKGNVTANEAKPAKETTDAPALAEEAAPLSSAVPSRQSRPKTRPTTSSARPQTRKPRKAAGSARSSGPIPSPGGPASTSAAALASSIATPNRRISAVAQSQTPQPNPQGDRNINQVVFGAVNFRAWYPSYYGKDVLGDTPSKTGAKDDHRGPAKVGGGKREKEGILERLFVCPCCFKYSRDEPLWLQHLQLCEKKALVPGHQIYTHPKARNHPGHTKKHAKAKGEAGPNALDEEASTKNEGEWSVWEVDGEKEPLFCQNLSLFAKLFLDNKSVFFDVAGFNYYLLVYTPASAPADPPASPEALEASKPTQARLPALGRPQIVGFFSKEKLSWDNNNVACILVFPPWQRKGLGVLLMGVSYEISRREELLGGPEKPISELGKKGYKRFWAGEIARWFLSLQGPENEEGEMVVDVEQCSEATWIAPEDCLAVLRDIGIVEEAGPGLPKVVPVANGEAEGDKGGKETEPVPRVKIDKAAVRGWVESQKIDLQRACDPTGFLEGYAVKKKEVEKEDA